MGEIKVTREALTSVARALDKFKRETELLPFDIQRTLSNMINECNTTISDVKKRLNELLDEESVFISSVFNKEREYESVLDEISFLKREIEILIMRKEDCERRAWDAESRASMSDDMATEYVYGCEASDMWAEAEMCQNQIYQNEYQISYLEDHASSLKNRINEDKEHLRRVTELRMRTENKLKRLQRAYSDVAMEADNLSIAVKMFDWKAMDTTTGNISSINRSIQLIDEYISINL